MKNIRATKGTNLMEIFLMEDRSTVLSAVKATLTPKEIGVLPMARK